MKISRHEDLAAWRLTRELKMAVLALIANERVQRDFKFRDQITDAAASAPSAVAEGFERFEHPEMAYFLRVAKSSVAEVLNHLQDGVDRHYWTESDCAAARVLARRARAAVLGLHRHVNATEAPGSTLRRNRRQTTRRGSAR
jgi:four helix bundle protein